ncbi:MAG TPA: class II aldolase/adducin family protein, partial [Methylocella sp.]|nr:class II aldolase/adducin family protein [Methylocella sp.]
AIIEACVKMNRSGLNQGVAGNISVRWNGGLLITPSGIAYEKLCPEDIILMTLEGGYRHKLAPSSEWRMHSDILAARDDVGAVVHAHSCYATAFAICGMEIPAVHYMIALAGGPVIRCARYETYGTKELSRVVLEALQDRNCALLANHGMVAMGRDLDEAMWRAVELEALCKQYAIALQIGRPLVLSDAEIAKNVEKFSNYGLRRKPGASYES